MRLLPPSHIAASRVCVFAFAGLLAVTPITRAEDGRDLSFQKQIRPILADYCQKCHSTEKQKGDVDLERFATAADARHEPKLWQDVLDQLASDEMPPKKARPLPPELKQQLASWAKGTLEEIALAHAGDPGPVVLRRLSNAEYTYTVRDLTGIEELNPAREFPVDGAAGEGFTNAGAALVMSPALLTKYFDAAKEIASHAVLLPDGFRFAPGTSARDWTDQLLAKIRAVYATYTVPGGATDLSLQGVKVRTNADGRLPLEPYLAALLQHREALRRGAVTLDAVAAEAGLSPKYLALLWEALNGTRSSFVLDRVRDAFAHAGADDAPKVAAVIRPWQEYLWRFFSVGHIGKKNGPTGWQQAWTPLGVRHEMRLKLPAAANGKEITLYLAAADIGNKGEPGIVQWENARLIPKKGAEVLLRDVPNALPESLVATAPGVLEIRIPAEMGVDHEFAVSAVLADASAPEACVQVQVLTAKPDTLDTATPGKTTELLAKGLWSDNNVRTTSSAPILVRDGSQARRGLEKAFDDFRAIFPLALCYTKIVPVDEVVTLTLFYREDDQLRRLMLDQAQAAALDRLWGELRFVSAWPLKQVDVFEQLYQFATQDADPSAFEPMREPVRQAAAAFRQEQAAAEPRQLQAVFEFAERAWRRPLSQIESESLRTLYRALREQGQPHDAALRLTLARVLVSPAFLYRGEKPAPGPDAAPVNDRELATRLSYFLVASTPDAELRRVAAAGRLHDPEVLAAQARRLLKDPRIRRLATEFGCQWLQVRDVETLDEKSERHFPSFASVRAAMQEEVVRFFTDLFQENRSMLSLLDADYTFLNPALAQHYGMALKGDDWQRVDGLHAGGRGGLLGFAAILAKQSGASRTSPILRGNWVSEVLLGEKLPRPPKGVPVLPDEAPAGLTERQLIERHSSDPSCARCHRRIDPFGFALEGFDAIGRARMDDVSGQPIDVRAQLADGTTFLGLEGLRGWLLQNRRDQFVRQFCRKLLGYALARGVQLSDQPLLDSMVAELKVNDYCVVRAIELIVASPQFRQVRGRETLADN